MENEFTFTLRELCSRHSSLKDGNLLCPVQTTLAVAKFRSWLLTLKPVFTCLRRPVFVPKVPNGIGERFVVAISNAPSRGTMPLANTDPL
ncbi:MAG: hypothetical protein ACI915_002297 [Gammaproteobacteria bacterium]|jgi:hypothetical protein